MATADKLKVKQIRSGIGRKKEQKETLRALGLGKIGREIVIEDTPSMRGMVNSVVHLVEINKI